MRSASALVVGLLLALTVRGPAAAATATAALRDLPPGAYELKISGTLCAACLRAIAFELQRNAAVESAKPDVAGESVRVSIRAGKRLTTKQLDKVLKRAAATANLAATYTVSSIRYDLPPLNPKKPL